MTRWDDNEFTANDLLLDREFIDCNGIPAGRVDDLELSDPEAGEPPVLTALLSGPTAFGPRLGGRLGTWWQAIGRRLRPVTDSYPNRINMELVDHVDRLEITLLAARAHLDSYRFRGWTEEKIIGRIPGSTK
ncbi:MAG TPA: hypothetical protein VGI96_37860 [Streptosporangiaceae bacterium]